MHTLVIQLGRLGDVIQTTPLLGDLAAAGDRVEVLLLHPNQAVISGMKGLATIRTIGEGLKPLDDQIAAGFTTRKIPAEATQLLRDLNLPRYSRVINVSHAALGCWLTAEISADSREGGVITRAGECLYAGAAQAYRIAMVAFRAQNWFNIVDLVRCAVQGRGKTPSLSTLREGTWREGSADARASRDRAVSGDTSSDRRLYMNASPALPFALPMGPKIALNVGASETGRQWPAEYFAMLAGGLAARGFAPILVGAPSDRRACAAVQATSCMVLPSFAGKTSIPEMARLLAECELLVSADTGAVHIAAAVGTRVVGLYGSAAYFAETSPYGAGHLILQTRIGAPMSALAVDTVLAAALNRLGRLNDLGLRRELASPGQNAWETDFLPPGVDPLGWLMLPAYPSAIVDGRRFVYARAPACICAGVLRGLGALAARRPMGRVLLGGRGFRTYEESVFGFTAKRRLTCARSRSDARSRGNLHGDERAA